MNGASDLGMNKFGGMMDLGKRERQLQGGNPLQGGKPLIERRRLEYKFFSLPRKRRKHNN